ncbi:MAG: hypothetical protein HC816_21795 [Leptolyngbyaceae cyanobacterium RM1_1_2]|nr:hypothetical protein [Leptolyngbyaceae cyanobacterium RM1_1_2]
MPTIENSDQVWRQHKGLKTLVQIIKRRRETSLIRIPGLGMRTVGNDSVAW